MRDSIELLGCRRIDHGDQVDDPALMERCPERDILCMICPKTLHMTI